MATLTKEEIEQLKQQLEEKRKEIMAIYDKLIEAGAVPLPEELLGEVAGGHPTTVKPLPTTVTYSHDRTDKPISSPKTYTEADLLQAYLDAFETLFH